MEGLNWDTVQEFTWRNSGNSGFRRKTMDMSG